MTRVDSDKLFSLVETAQCMLQLGGTVPTEHPSLKTASIEGLHPAASSRLYRCAFADYHEETFSQNRIDFARLIVDTKVDRCCREGQDSPILFLRALFLLKCSCDSHRTLTKTCTGFQCIGRNLT